MKINKKRLKVKEHQKRLVSQNPKGRKEFKEWTTGQNVTEIKHGELEEITLGIQTSIILSKMDLGKIQVKARLHNKSQSWSRDIYSIIEAEEKPENNELL